MRLQNLQLNRVLRAVLIVTAIATALSFGACYCFLIGELVDEVDPEADLSTQQEQLQKRAPEIVEDVLRDPPPGLNLLFLGQLGLVVLLAFWQSYWAARSATSPEQAGGYGLAVGVGVLVTYGMLLLVFGPISFLYKVAFYAALLAATITGGRLAGQRLDRFGVALDKSRQFDASPFGGPDFGPVTPSLAPGQLSGPTSRVENAQVYYNMGVSAAMGGRRDEARQHFTRALQIDPRHLLAWLELANLSGTPEQAWGYIQQARALDPNHPSVIQAVDLIWPQIADKAAGGAPPLGQPPYHGTPPDEPGIIRSQMPLQTPPGAEVVQFPIEAPPELVEDDGEALPPWPDDEPGNPPAAPDQT
ncbi:MAG: tetratricopeptide repeat protein [Anaerolineae bacterium]|nr:tetratricopeptide repeat protein [Anaerolineae bacterium]